MHRFERHAASPHRSFDADCVRLPVELRKKLQEKEQHLRSSPENGPSDEGADRGRH